MKNALLCGASSGIGYCLAQRLIADGYSVTNCSRKQCELDGVENITADLSKSEQREEVYSWLAQKEDLELFVYSAGFSMCAPFEYVTNQDARYLFEVDFFAACEIIAKVVPLMKKNGGTIILVSSIAGFVPIPFDAYYTAAKAALNALAIELNTELNRFGVKVKAVCPGGTATDFTFKRVVYTDEQAHEYYPQMLSGAAVLANIEQSGATPQRAAEQIMCALGSSSAVVPLGLKNKVIKAICSFAPSALIVYMLKKVFRT